MFLYPARRFLGGDITAPTPPRALRDDRVSMPIDFSRFYYVAPELERYDGTEPFFSKLNYDHDYETVPMESVSMAAITAAIEERQVGVFRSYSLPLCEGITGPG